MDLMFHDEETFLKYALSKEEPEQSLESLTHKHDEVCEKLRLFQEEKTQEETKWRKTITNSDGTVETVIDNHRWKKSDPESYDRFDSSGYFASEFIKWCEEMIDIKICHMNKRD